MVFVMVAGATLFGGGLNQAFVNLANFLDTLDNHL
jgi:hypothetical protein